MSDNTEIHIKRRFNSPQTLCMEHTAQGIIDAVHIMRALTLDEVFVAVHGSFPTSRINMCNCIPCITVMQDVLATVLHLASNRIRVLHENTCNALDEHIMKATDSALDKAIELAKDTNKKLQQLSADLKEP